MTFKSVHISVSINRPANEVYEFVSNPENLPEWAAGLSGSIRKVGKDWVADSSMGTIKIKFADKNEFGVLDHDVTLPSGVKIYNPMRVFPNSDGSELIFTLYQRPDMSEQMVAEDAKAVAKDLQKLNTLLEKTSLKRKWYMTEMSHREIAVSFLNFREDCESLMIAMEENATKNPNKKLEIKLTLEDKNLTATYSHVQQNPGDPGGAVVHIFRFEGDHIVEMWDIGQAVPEDSPNESGMF